MNTNVSAGNRGETVKNNWLFEFLEQSLSGDLKFAHYPKDHDGLKMKVSFGQGVPARCPWVAFLAEGMSVSNGYYPVFLFYKAEKKLVLSFGVSETNEFDSTWKSNIVENYKRVDEVVQSAARYGSSWVYRTYDVLESEGQLKLSVDGTEISSKDVDEDLDQIVQFYSDSLDEATRKPDSQFGAGLFYMEKQLEDFIIENWNNTEFGDELELIYDDGVLLSQQYRTDVGPIDILAKRKDGLGYTVIELKKNQTSDDTIGQVLRYMGWVKQQFPGEIVEGLVVAGKYDKRLQYAASMVPNVDVYVYEVSFQLKAMDNNNAQLGWGSTR